MRTSWTVLLVLFAPLSAQKDLRDVVVTTADKEIRGRVVQRFADDELLLVQGGKRVRVPRKEVASVTTVNDHLCEFFALRQTARGSDARGWTLVEWAASKELDRMARLQALDVVSQYPDHAKAHAFLGHREKGSTWLWPVDSGWGTRERFEEHAGDFGHPLVLESEHFTLKTDAGLRRGLDAIFDLERVYLWWIDVFGQDLRPREVLEPMLVHAHRSVGDFPPFTSTRYPYYYPQPNGDVSYTFFAAGATRPELLFELAVEQIMYNALADGMPAGTSPKDRFAAWIEIGLGQWAEACFGGDAGYAEPTKLELDQRQALLTLTERPYSLQNLIGIRYAMFHDPTSQAPLHWSNAATFVAFLLDEENGLNTRAPFLRYVDLVYTQGRGSSSSILDECLGTRVEELERPWIAWLEQKTGARATRWNR